MQRVINRRGDKRVDVVDEGDVRFYAADDVVDLTARLPGINALGEKQSFLENIEVLDLVIVPAIEDDFVSVALEQLRLRLNDRVFASILLVRTVYEKNSHA